ALADHEAQQPAIERVHADDALDLRNLGLSIAGGRQLLSEADLHIAAGERVMLSGRSGSGKSSLLRALGGLWPHGSGQIRLPAEPALFLPQRPYLPIGTLREAMSYPQSADHYSPERFADALKKCRLEHLIPRLDESNHWQRFLSPGEQQRMAFARALLVAPRWLYMDEATSAMDEEDEAAMHRAIIDGLPGLTLFSIGHRSSLKRFHSRHVRVEDGKLIEQAASGAV
ncbi:ATP-binding cassette domain-containing protein, partial [Pseudomonas syringae]|uniref:ATP-binding cassette domain-containing protein n=1 Tax=Pseudomonas syringae TaxID=317 RepID=UPI000A931786